MKYMFITAVIMCVSHLHFYKSMAQGMMEYPTKIAKRIHMKVAHSAQPSRAKGPS